ncbi:MAG: lipopolysaccharide kinase InaA family protein [Planctomycetota bacterium]|jgi:tRNA A-37 threonylcarbamoyl transferase component Bud32
MPEFMFDKLRKRSNVVWVNKKYRTMMLSLGIYKPWRFVEKYQVGVIDDVTRSKIVSTEVPTTKDSMRLAVKTYHRRGICAAVKDMLRRSRGVREFLFSGKLFAAGIPVPEPVAAVERRRFRSVRECSFISVEIVGAKSCYMIVAEQKIFGNWPEDIRDTFIRRLGRAVGDVHARGYAHGDMNMSHLIVSPVDPEQWAKLGPDVHFVDFEGGRLLTNKPPRNLRVRDLMRFIRSFRKFATESECVAFFKAYSAAAGEGEETGKEYHNMANEMFGPAESAV